MTDAGENRIRELMQRWSVSRDVAIEMLQLERYGGDVIEVDARGRPKPAGESPKKQ